MTIDVQPLTKTPSPGPSKYGMPSGVGAQVLSNRRSAPSTTFGAAPGFDEAKASSPRSPRSPAQGPGFYNTPSMLGLQQQSTYTSFGGFKFGTSDRQPIGTIYR